MKIKSKLKSKVIKSTRRRLVKQDAVDSVRVPPAVTVPILSIPKTPHPATVKGNNGGRPPRFKTNEELEAMVESYFLNCPDLLDDKPCPTVTGLALYLGFCDRHSFYDYEKREEFSHTIKRARGLMERKYEQRLTTTSPTGSIFALKNFGWKDTQESVVKLEGEITVKHEEVEDRLSCLTKPSEN